MSQPAKDAYWKPSYDTLYKAYYQEILSDALVERWQGIDVATALLVAATASGSAFAGLALWSEPSLKIVWGIIAGVAAIASIIRSVMGVTSRVKDQTDLRHAFLQLRVDVETFRLQLAIEMNMDEAKNRFSELRKTLAECLGRTSPDFAETKGLRSNVQKRLDDIMKAEGYSL